jgi:hypothetical protein
MSGSNIQEILEECKGTLIKRAGEYGPILIVLLVAFSSFGLGRLSVSDTLRAPVSVYEAPAKSAISALTMGGEIVASKTGTVYYYPWCGGVKSIIPQSTVWFKSEELAQAAGYRPAKNCKGLGGS